MNQQIKQIIKKNLGSENLKFNEPMSRHTTFGIGGSAEIFYTTRTTGDLVRAVKLARKLKIPFFVLGRGSNVLVLDKGLHGIVIKILNSQFSILNSRINADAGVLTSQLVKLAADNSLTGAECLAGIPGTIGGAIYGNAGTKGRAIGNIVSKVTVLGKDNKIYDLLAQECGFSYRSSRFKKSNEIILSAVLVLKKGLIAEINKKIKKVLEKRENQPQGKSAGSIFKNPKGRLAGELIEKAGLKGMRVGGALVSDKHANYIINDKKAKASDVLQLILLIKKKVKKKFGVELEEEIVIID